MPFTLSLPSLAALFVGLFILALAPNLSVLIVTTRAATSGFKQGLFATLGIVAAISVYILASIFGLMIVADMRPEARHILRILGAVYLVWGGMNMIRNAGVGPRASLPVTHRTAASFSMGFILTLLNVKTLLFYLSFLPVFISVGSLNLRATQTLLVVAAVAGITAKMGYILASLGGKVVPSVTVGKILNVIAGAVVAVSGFALATGRFIRP
jgi:threonine/homoserine/homoserine lactone efflux protein